MHAISEPGQPATAFKVDRRGCLNKTNPIYRAITGTLHFACPMCRLALEAWNMKLISNYCPSVVLLLLLRLIALRNVAADARP